MGWLSEPLARVKALIGGTYPVTPVTGRSVPAETFVARRVQGDLASPNFPGNLFHRAFDFVVEASGGVPGDPPNVHAGSMRRRAVVLLRIGYLDGENAPVAGDEIPYYTPSATGHDDHEAIEQALRYPAFWGGTTPAIVGLIPLGDATTQVIVPHERFLVVRRWEITCTYAPGTVHS